eukprot:9709909-Karenia_brevis.AAC.1
MLPDDPPCDWKHVSRVTTLNVSNDKLLQDIENVKAYNVSHFRRTIGPATEKVFHIETRIIYYDKVDPTPDSSSGIEN